VLPVQPQLKATASKEVRNAGEVLLVRSQSCRGRPFQVVRPTAEEKAWPDIALPRRTQRDNQVPANHRGQQKCLCNALLTSKLVGAHPFMTSTR